MTGIQRAGAPRGLERAGRRGVRWPWLIGGIGLALLKTNGLAEVLHHRLEVIAFLGLALVFSTMRLRLVGIAATAAPLLAFALAPHRTALGFALGFGAFALLLALFIVVGTVLRARQQQDRTDPVTR